jgi:hypothetical protein
MPSASASTRSKSPRSTAPFRKDIHSSSSNAIPMVGKVVYATICRNTMHSARYEEMAKVGCGELLMVCQSKKKRNDGLPPLISYLQDTCINKSIEPGFHLNI